MDAATAVALVGIPQPPDFPPCRTKPLVPPIRKDRTAPLANFPPVTRVSRMRQGGMAIWTASDRAGSLGEKCCSSGVWTTTGGE